MSTKYKNITPIELTAMDFDGLNFVVHHPTWLPEDCTLTSTTKRKECINRNLIDDSLPKGASPWSKSDPSTLYSIIKGRDRSLRIKQFFYDWAPPAAGMPNLWESNQNDCLKLDDSIGWLGFDYYGNFSACISKNRTQIEISVLKGDYSAEELEKILRFVKPIENSEHNAFQGSRLFFDQCFWVRERIEGLKVPHGLYLYNARHSFDKAIVTSLASINTRLKIHLSSRLDDLEFDSAIHIEVPDDSIECVEAIYESRCNPNKRLWLHIEKINSLFPIQIPPQLDDHFIEQRDVEQVDDIEIYFASINLKYGSHEAFWKTGNLKFAIWSMPAREQSYQAFKAMVYELATCL